MNTAIKRELLEKIKQYDKIIISRHLRPDGDAVGSTLGLQRMLKLTYPEKEVLCCIKNATIAEMLPN